MKKMSIRSVHAAMNVLLSYSIKHDRDLIHPSLNARKIVEPTRLFADWIARCNRCSCPFDPISILVHTITNRPTALHISIAAVQVAPWYKASRGRILCGCKVFFLTLGGFLFPCCIQNKQSVSNRCLIKVVA